MAFEVIQKSTRGNKEKLTGVLVTKYNKQAAAIVIAPDVMGLLGWTAGNNEKATVFVGTGEDAGYFKIARSQHGYAIARDGSKASTARICCSSFLPKSVSRMSKTRCRYNIVNGDLIVEIPRNVRPVATVQTETQPTHFAA